MVRSFSDRPLDPALVERLLDDSLRAPSAGNTRGTSWVLLTGRDETWRYWEPATTGDWRARSSRWPGLARAPVVAVSVASAPAYLDRYAETDKASSGLGAPERGGGGEPAWPVPYWLTDAAFSTILLLLGAVDAGIGACFLGNFRAEVEILESLGVPAGRRLFGAVALGHPDDRDHPSPSLNRPREPGGPEGRIRRGGW